MIIYFLYMYGLKKVFRNVLQPAWVRISHCLQVKQAEKRVPFDTNPQEDDTPQVPWDG